MPLALTVLPLHLTPCQKPSLEAEIPLTRLLEQFFLVLSCSSLPVHTYNGSTLSTTTGGTISILAFAWEDCGGRLCCDSVITIKGWVCAELFVLIADLTVANFPSVVIHWGSIFSISG